MVKVMNLKRNVLENKIGMKEKNLEINILGGHRRKPTAKNERINVTKNDTVSPPILHLHAKRSVK